MTYDLIKQEYEREREEIKEQIKAFTKPLNEQLETLRKEYLHNARPCDIGQLVEIERNNGTRITGIADSFGILSDGFVYVTSLKVGTTKKVYISQPYKSIKVLKDETN
jgi:hypothetical protein